MNLAAMLQALAILAWLVTAGFIALVVIRSARGRAIKKGNVFVIVLIAVSAISTTVSAGLVFIQPEERGVVISAVAPKGYREQVLQPGLRWIVPFAESVRLYTISRQTYTMSIAPAEGQVYGDDSISARTSDGQEAFVDASVIYTIDPEKIIELHIAWQDRFQDEVVRPLARGVIRDVVSQYGI